MSFLTILFPLITITYSSNCVKKEQQDLPNDDNDEIQHVPTVPHVRVLVHHQTISNDLQERLDGENDEEGILNCFLQTQTKTQNMFLIASRYNGLSVQALMF